MRFLERRSLLYWHDCGARCWAMRAAASTPRPRAVKSARLLRVVKCAAACPSAPLAGWRAPLARHCALPDARAEMRATWSAWRLGGVAVVLVLVLSACGAPAPPPTPVPTSVPTAVPSPTASTPGEAPSDVENAFLSDVDDLIGEATDLSVTPCDDLTVIVRQNPNLLPSIKGFAATMKRASTNQAALNSQAVKSAMDDLDKSISQLDGALSQCGISTSAP